MVSFQVDEERGTAFREGQFWLAALLGTAIAGASIGSALASLLAQG
jgi:hypothetical protein